MRLNKQVKANNEKTFIGIIKIWNAPYRTNGYPLIKCTNYR